MYINNQFNVNKYTFLDVIISIFACQCSATFATDTQVSLF